MIVFSALVFIFRLCPSSAKSPLCFTLKTLIAKDKWPICSWDQARWGSLACSSIDDFTKQIEYSCNIVCSMCFAICQMILSIWGINRMNYLCHPRDSPFNRERRWKKFLLCVPYCQFLDWQSSLRISISLYCHEICHIYVLQISLLVAPYVDAKGTNDLPRWSCLPRSDQNNSLFTVSFMLLISHLHQTMLLSIATRQVILSDSRSNSWLSNNRWASSNFIGSWLCHKVTLFLPTISPQSAFIGSLTNINCSPSIPLTLVSGRIGVWLSVLRFNISWLHLSHPENHLLPQKASFGVQILPMEGTRRSHTSQLWR